MQPKKCLFRLILVLTLGASVSAQPAAPNAIPSASAAPIPPALLPGAGPVVVTNVLPDGTTNYVVRNRSSRRNLRPTEPPFELKEGDRIVFLGDTVLADEAKYGRLETRITTHFPTRNLTFRNLAWAEESPLTQARLAAKAGPGGGDDGWLKRVLALVGPLKPTVVIAGYGSSVATNDEAALPGFRTNYARLLEGIKRLDTNVPVRFVLLGPIYHEPPSESSNPVRHNQQLSLYNRAIEELAQANHAEYIDLHTGMQIEAGIGKSRQHDRGGVYDPLLDQDLRFTVYGWSRVSLVLQRAFRWNPNTWRFGYLADNTMREGGYGLDWSQRERSDRHVHLEALEAELPNPNVPGHPDLESGYQPHCYIQVLGLKPGNYTLKIDGRPILSGSEGEWGRYEVVAQGPSWDQAEELRQTIVKKNQRCRELWEKAESGSDSGGSQRNAKAADPTLTDAAVKDLEARIAKLRKPVRHTIDIVAADAPAAAPTKP